MDKDEVEADIKRLVTTDQYWKNIEYLDTKTVGFIAEIYSEEGKHEKSFRIRIELEEVDFDEKS